MKTGEMSVPKEMSMSKEPRMSKEMRMPNGHGGLTSDTVEARLHNARSLLVEVLIRQFGPAFGGVFQLGDSRCERITNAVMDRLFPRR
jgi:hypothetical protein